MTSLVVKVNSGESSYEACFKLRLSRPGGMSCLREMVRRREYA